MKPGEAFEIRCYEYLRKKYNVENLSFHREGGMDSTKSDIAVLKHDTLSYYIETKDTSAQSGQFVLHPDENTKEFVFSPKNHSTPNEMTNIIIKYMNKNFDRFNNAGTAGEALDIDSSVFANWIMNHYLEKNVKYVMSYKSDYVILPIRKFSSYFDILAKYRIKKSGSSEPAQKDIDNVIEIIKQAYPVAKFSRNEKKLYVSISTILDKEKFILGKYTYYLSKQSTNFYEVRRLSNTYNMNVIFSIQLKKSQDNDDLIEFESDL